jgi:lipopolysaccharide export LptBFGC system permease protein LptF
VNRPGDRLRAFAAAWCCPETMERVIDPLITDLQVEYADAVRRGQPWEGRRVYISAWIAFFKVIAICTWSSGLAWHRWTADERRMLVRTLTFSTVLIITVTALLELTPIMNAAQSWRSARLWLYLIPQALPLAVAIGALGIVFGVGGRAFSRRVTAGLVLLALTVSVASLVDLAWIVPAANQEFRMAVAGRADLLKGASELTLGELSREIEIVQRNESGLAYWYSTTWEGHLRELAFNYHLRWALAFSPLVLVLFALSIAAGSALKRWMLAVAACGALFSYYQLLYAGRELVLSGRIPAYVSAWFPNAVFTLLTAFLILRRSRAGCW